MSWLVKDLLEMAQNSGDSSYSRLETNHKNVRSEYFDDSKDWNSKNIATDLKLHSKKNDDLTSYRTNDHKNRETLHLAEFSKHTKDIKFPYDHEVQTSVDRVKSTDVLPKGHATTVAYDHFKSSIVPLRSSKEQFRKGHEMWHRLVDRALADGHHVYHWDSKSLHKTTEENKKDHLDDSFGHGDSYADRHMMISKNALK